MHNRKGNMYDRKGICMMEKETGQTSTLESELDLYLRRLQGNFSELEKTKIIMDSDPLKDVVFVFTSDGIGSGGENLSKLLLRFMLKSLINHSVKPRALILMHNAVLLTVDSSPLLGNLTVLIEQGLRILVCSTSVDYHQIEDKVKAGHIADMNAILSELLNARNVITF